MFHLRPVHGLLLATLTALAGCAGGGATSTTTTGCMPGAALYPLFRDPMTQPPAGAVGVATTVGSITVPVMNNVEGATVHFYAVPSSQEAAAGGVFVASGSSSLTATIPKLQPNTTYQFGTTGVPCGPYFDFGQFTTGPT